MSRFELIYVLVSCSWLAMVNRRQLEDPSPVLQQSQTEYTGTVHTSTTPRTAYQQYGCYKRYYTCFFEGCRRVSTCSIVWAVLSGWTRGSPCGNARYWKLIHFKQLKRLILVVLIWKYNCTYGCVFGCIHTFGHLLFVYIHLLPYRSAG